MIIDAETAQMIEENDHPKRWISSQCRSNGVDLVAQKRRERVDSYHSGRKYLPVRIRTDPCRSRAKRCRFVLWLERNLFSIVERNLSVRREHRNSLPEERTKDHSWRSNRIYSNKKKKKKTKYSSTTKEEKCLVRWHRDTYNQQNEV